MKPVDRIGPLDWMAAPGVGAVIAALTAKGAVVRFVGGCVRDAVIGKPMGGDIDLATTDPPETVASSRLHASIRLGGKRRRTSSSSARRSRRPALSWPKSLRTNAP